ncbi:acylpyruvase FAHD1, mitochondrial [Schistocerca americana]|uniref:acylpyruvase FAHD1, mitochondrial n=1 Tax=Schistocerca americana TaxID=7009 RepID=UPI001F4F2463|nr:acylpyruvase FAHD1, mitochondrial [Schistocerca americana]XP_049804460.1 acylpyruvase FAHD1, mitochondrial [Schistocerca nitens]XP_049939294.1 acylpyruvase FAHD1, mitochondrial [Schistocerca serialis cubense]
MSYTTEQLKNFTKIGKKIIGAGLNYKELVKLSKQPAPKTPIIFLKPTSAYITEGSSIEIYPDSHVNEEVELGVIIGRKGRNISVADAMSHVGGYCLGLDMTEISIINECQAKGLPWALGKGFDTACPVSRFISCDEIQDPGNLQLWLKVNGKTFQDSNTSDMLFSIPELISYVSKFITLEEGDMILTGSPPGFDRVQPGDVIEAGIGNILAMKFPVKART